METDQHLTLRNSYWDCEQKTLTQEITTYVVLERETVFAVDLTGPTLILPVGAIVRGDEFVIYRFDCDCKLVFYREYFSLGQFVSTYTDDYPHYKFDKKCDKERAIQVANQLNFAIGLLSIDVKAAVKMFVNEFNERGVLRTAINPTTYPPQQPYPQSNFTGHHQIKRYLLNSIATAGETNQHVETKFNFWDCKKRVLSIQRTWTATLTAPRAVSNNSPQGYIILNAGTTYQRDDLIIIKFDCNYKIVYYRAYYENNQYQSTYPVLVAPVCTVNCEYRCD